MLKNYLISALRFLKRNKLFAGINILGLSLALAASFIILLFVINELSYNGGFNNRKQIYRVLQYYTDSKLTSDETSYVLSKCIKEEFSQVKQVAPTYKMREFKIKLDDEFIPVRNALSSNSEIFKIFSINVSGQQKNILDAKNSIVLSRTLARKIFPEKDPIGIDLTATVNDKTEVFVVSGIFDDIPVNSTLQADCFVSPKWALEQLAIRVKRGNAETNWHPGDWKTWLLLGENTDMASIDKQFRDLEKRVLGEKDEFDFSLQCLSDVYLNSHGINSSDPQGNMKNIQIFSAIAILIIIVAAFNYIILSTAVSTGRSKEIGIRKTTGASVVSIRKQLLSESVVLVLMVLPIALFLAWWSKPFAENLFQTKLLIIRSNILFYVTVYLALTLFIGLASGLYTATFLSRLNAISILNDPLKAGKRKIRFRYALIVVQLAIFCSFVSGTLVIRAQYKFALEASPGYYNKDVLFVNMGNNASDSKAFISNLKAYPNVVSVGGATNSFPMIGTWTYPIELPGDKSKKIPIELLAVDYDFIETMGIQLLEGRSFSRQVAADNEHSYLLNEKAVKALELTDPVGKQIDAEQGTIIGIVKDFNVHSVHNEIPPLLIVASDAYVMQVAVHYKTGSFDSLLPLIKNEWEKIAPGQPFVYKTIEDLKKEIYSEEKNLSLIVSISALFTMLIASFGLFGLTLYLIKNQTKEIGIKKVFGSSEKMIVFSFLRKNLIMVVIATILSVPATIVVMKRWLSNFAFKTDIDWWVFGLAFLVAASVVLTTVLYHSLRISRVNPVDALRYE